MQIDRRRLLGAMATGAAALALPSRLVAADVLSERNLIDQAKAALDRHSASILNTDVVGIVDFAHPSRTPRFQLVDLVGGSVQQTWLVAHGSGSDPANSGWLERFSNRPGSNASSQGAFLTGDTYSGKHGRSRRLIGLDPENNRALERDIVIHGASYVDEGLAAVQGRIGRSQGCFAVSWNDIGEVLERLGPGHLLFAAK